MTEEYKIPQDILDLKKLVGKRARVGSLTGTVVRVKWRLVFIKSDENGDEIGFPAKMVEPEE